MNLTNEQYKKYTLRHAKPSPVLKNTAMAFLVGGSICTLGQIFMYIYLALGMEKTLASTLTSVTLVLISVILTALDVYDTVAKTGGAGTLVPITGFANAVVAPAIDNKAEGYVLGLGAKLFVIAGPVILYGTLSSVLYGIVFAIKLRFGG